MTALALDLRELSLDEIDWVAGGPGPTAPPAPRPPNNDNFAREVAVAVAATVVAKVVLHPVVILGVVILAFTATPAHGNGSENR